MNPSNTRITFSQLSDYLDSGATLAQVRDMISILRDYVEGVTNDICEWRDYIPAVEPTDDNTNDTIWCYSKRRENPQVNLNIVLVFLYQQGYTVNIPVLDKDRVSATWEVLKNGRVSKLEYKPGKGYSLNGAPFKLKALKK